MNPLVLGFVIVYAVKYSEGKCRDVMPKEVCEEQKARCGIEANTNLHALCQKTCNRCGTGSGGSTGKGKGTGTGKGKGTGTGKGKGTGTGTGGFRGHSVKDRRICLEDANKYRRMHGIGELKTEDLTYDIQLEKQAQKWANELLKTGEFEHDYDSAEKYLTGENLYYRTMYLTEKERKKAGLSFYCKKADKMWHDETKDYDYSTGKLIPGHLDKKGKPLPIGHLTQMVWTKSAKVGYGYAKKLLPNGLTKGVVVARYSPRGNAKDAKGAKGAYLTKYVLPLNGKPFEKDELVEEDIVEDQDEVEETNIWEDEMGEEFSEEEPEEWLQN